MVMLYPSPRAAIREEKSGLRRVIPLIVLILLSPLAPLGGLGVDALRGYMVQARLSRAIDAAALAGGRVFFDSQRNSHITRFFQTAFPSGFLGSVPPEIEVLVDTDKGTLTVSGKTALKRTFFDMLGLGKVTLQAEAKVYKPSRNADPVLEPSR